MVGVVVVSSSLIIQVRVILMPPGYPDPAAGQRIDKKGAFNSRICIQTVSAAAALMSSLVSKGAMLVRLQHEAYMTYDCGKYVESLRIAEEIYAIDAVTKKALIFPESPFCAIQARSDNLLLLGAINFQLRNFSEAVFFNQQVLKHILIVFKIAFPRQSALSPRWRRRIQTWQMPSGSLVMYKGQWGR